VFAPKRGYWIIPLGPWFEKLTMRFKPLKSLYLILSLSKDEAEISAFFSIMRS